MRTLVICILGCCLFSMSLTAQQNDPVQDKRDPGNEIETVLDKAVWTPPAWASIHNNAGMVYLKNHQFSEAHSAFSMYEKLFPNEGQAYYNWAAYYALRHQYETAVMYLRKAVDLGYNDLNWLNTDDSMNALRNEAVFIAIVKTLKQSGQE